MGPNDVQDAIRSAFIVGEVQLGAAKGMRNASDTIAYLRRRNLSWRQITEIINAACGAKPVVTEAAVRRAGSRIMAQKTTKELDAGGQEHSRSVSFDPPRAEVNGKTHRATRENPGTSSKLQLKGERKHPRSAILGTSQLRDVTQQIEDIK